MGKILIVEDEPDVRRVLKLTLELAGHRVSEAKTGEEGLLMAAGANPDVIILDIMLPGMGGGEVLQRLRKAAETAPIPVIIVTASAQAAESLQWEVGTANTFTKPFHPDQLTTRVAEILSGGQQG